MKKFLFIISLFLLLVIFIPTQTPAVFGAPVAPSQPPMYSFPPVPAPSMPPFPIPSPQIKIKEIKIDGDYKRRKNLAELEFRHLDHVKSFTYTFTYTHNGINEGIVGNVNPNGAKKIEKEVFLGTCSTNSCVPHLNPVNMKLQVTGQYINNQPFFKEVNID